MTHTIVPSRSAKGMGKEDPLEYLTTLFELVELDSDDSDYPDDSSEYDSDSTDDSEPRSKDYYDNRYYFTVSNRSYYFDNDRNVYSEAGTLVHDSSLNLLKEDLLAPSFYVDGTPYWFGVDDGLFFQDDNGVLHPVHIRQKEPEVFNLLQFLNLPPMPTGDTATSQVNLNSESHYGLQVPTIVLTPDSTPETPIEAPKLAFSPASSTSKSPIVPAGSPAPSEDPPLFPPSPPGKSQGASILSAWRQDLKQAQQAAARARPVKKPSKEDNRRCPICGKLFHRPGGLGEHLNVHSGAKPHKCPFEKCRTGFATKSNLNRHFLTHQVGQLKDYRPGMSYKPDAAKSGRAPIATYNSKAHHTGRFRIFL